MDRREAIDVLTGMRYSPVKNGANKFAVAFYAWCEMIIDMSEGEGFCSFGKEVDTLEFVPDGKE